MPQKFIEIVINHIILLQSHCIKQVVKINNRAAFIDTSNCILTRIKVFQFFIIQYFTMRYGNSVLFSKYPKNSTKKIDAAGIIFTYCYCCSYS